MVPIKYELGQYQVVDSREVKAATNDGWELIERFTERDTLIIDRSYETGEERDRARIGERVAFLFFRHADNAMTKLAAERDAEAAARWKAENAKRDADARAAKAEKALAERSDADEYTSTTLATAREQLTAARSTLALMEMHIAAARKDDQEIPF